MNIILDIDGTLINDVPNENDELIPRPFLTEFLDYCFENFQNVSIWTAATSGWYIYVRSKFLIGRNFDFVHTRYNCTRIADPDPDTLHPEPILIKPLKKIWRKTGYNRHNTLIIDDTPHTYQKNYGNAIHIPTFLGSKDDTCLQDIIELLDTLKIEFEETGTIRRFDKKIFKQ